MCDITEKITDRESVILDNMFEGDQDRDASDKVRGFIYQDYVALDFLLDDETEFVCLEFLEDVDIFCKDGTLKYIQVKYYPKTRPNMKEIMTDLYYQYLRFDILGSEFKLNPLIVIHKNGTVNLPDKCKMKKYVEIYSKEKPVTKSHTHEWFRNEIYVLNKSDQKKKLFKEAAYEKSIEEFLQVVNLQHNSNIFEFQLNLEKKLGKLFKDENSFLDDEDRNKILFGLAINYIQRRYFIDSPKFQTLKVSRKEFIQYIETNWYGTYESQIISYLVAIVNERFASILHENPDIEEYQQKILDLIVKNTQKWLVEIETTIDKQFQIINTLSRDSFEKIEQFRLANVSTRLKMFIKCEDSINGFLDYLWKIMWNLCMSKKDFDLKVDFNMLDPKTYMNEEINDYICLKFEQDYVQTSAILPIARRGHFDSDLKNICSRMIKQKPQKWFMENADSGKHEYSYNTAHILEPDSITNIEEDSFYIECMECIKVDQNIWNKPENCNDCIFAEKCIKGVRKK